jgi:pimeloyl-ACP methyl ester carboxylesterase
MKPIAQNMMAMWDTISPELYQQQQKMMLYTMISAPEKIELAFKWGKSSDRATVSQAMYELYTTDLRDDIAEIEAPTLVLGSWIGYKDYGVTKEMIQRSFDYQYSRLDKVEIKISDTGKHFIMWDDFDFYIDEIEQFLNANPIEG